MDYRSRFEDQASSAQSDLESEAFSLLWEAQPALFLREYCAGKSSRGAFLTGLLGRQAWLERRFLIALAEGDAAAWPLFHEMVAARYIRTLCLLHRCARTEWKQEILWPEISELGRTILLLSCCGWLKEAGELAHRARHMILSHQNQFVPLIPWFGIVWGTQNPDVLGHGAVDKFHQPTLKDVEWVLRNWQGDDLDGLAERLARIADRRRWMMGQFDDEYHIDFDDGLSWTVPYEVGAVLSARRAKGLPVPDVDHPIFALPTAGFELASGPVTHYQDLYARFIGEM